MAGNTKRVFYVKYLAAPDYAETLAQRPDVRLDKLENESPDDVAVPVFSQAHAYQIGSARDQIATPVYAPPPPFGRSPNPLIVSTQRVRYDNVQPKECTPARALGVN